MMLTLTVILALLHDPERVVAVVNCSSALSFELKGIVIVSTRSSGGIGSLSVTVTSTSSRACNHARSENHFSLYIYILPYMHVHNAYKYIMYMYVIRIYDPLSNVTHSNTIIIERKSCSKQQSLSQEREPGLRLYRYLTSPICLAL